MAIETSDPSITANLSESAPQFVFIERAKCPTCGGTDLLTRRTSQNGDGTVSRNTLCRSCKTKFVVVVE